MKTTLKYILTGLCAISLAACSLDRAPETTLTDSGFWNTESDLKAACNYLYNLLGGSLGGFNHDQRADEQYGTSSNSISNGNRTVPNTSTDWSNPYKRIFVSNNILEKGVKAEVPEDVRNKYFAEALFFRAFHYFELVKKYGDVPLIITPISSTNDPRLEMPRTDREKVIDQCYEDLEFAATWLPDADAQTWGRVSRSAALALAVRIGLYEGTYAKYHSITGSDPNKHFDKAITAAETLMSEKRHSLYPDFNNLFQFEGEGRQNKEAIFVKIYGPNEAGTTVHANSRNMEKTNLTRKMVDLFLYADGLPASKTSFSTAETRYNDVFNNRDPRLGMTCFKCGDVCYKKTTFLPFTDNWNGYKIRKGYNQADYETNQNEVIDKMIIRYAEVLISYAEALYERNGAITDDQLDKTVNALRARVGFTAKLTNAFASSKGLNMLEEIRRERTVEFIDECFRYDDLIRWKTAEKELVTDLLGSKFFEEDSAASYKEISNRLNSDGIYIMEKASDRKFDPLKDYLYPIPTQEIALSSKAVTQNPGWNN